MSDDVRARGVATGLSSDDQAASRLDLPGFDPSRMTMDEARNLAERLANRDPNKMEFMSRRWDAYRYVVPQVIAVLGLLKPEVHPDVLAVRKMLHAHQRAMTPPDSGWGNMSYLRGDYDHLPTFNAALAAYRDSDRSGEAGETRSGSTVGESAGPQGHRPNDGTGEPQ